MLKCTECDTVLDEDDACHMETGETYCDDCAAGVGLLFCNGCGFYFEAKEVADHGDLQFCTGCVAEGLHKGENDGK